MLFFQVPTVECDTTYNLLVESSTSVDNQTSDAFKQTKCFEYMGWYETTHEWRTTLKLFQDIR